MAESRQVGYLRAPMTHCLSTSSVATGVSRNEHPVERVVSYAEGVLSLGLETHRSYH